MKKTSVQLLLSAIFFLITSSCKDKVPFKPPHDGASGTVIAKETCNTDEGKDYWLIEISSSSSVQQQFGDKLTLNGITYTNVIKTTGLPESLKKVGQKVGFDFTIAGTATSTSNCSVSTPVVIYSQSSGTHTRKPSCLLTNLSHFSSK
ncbi:hypothetical protein [Pedobacter alluvionis]|uniref:Lipoprotein n=1 Tax=Pedobacter alluvionis TaxID=475253 RepID=A0ABY2HIB1_9SPHI|nr:hypothetical protein [Pedobacter alluvionis]TFB28363.1 hypothetical protein E3V97_23050 [Pedobacter alluvionis]